MTRRRTRKRACAARTPSNATAHRAASHVALPAPPPPVVVDQHALGFWVGQTPSGCSNDRAGRPPRWRRQPVVRTIQQRRFAVSLDGRVVLAAALEARRRRRARTACEAEHHKRDDSTRTYITRATRWCTLDGVGISGRLGAASSSGERREFPRRVRKPRDR